MHSVSATLWSTRISSVRFLFNFSSVSEKWWHSIVPEKYRYWKSNLPGVCSHPVAVCSGSLGSILVLDFDFALCFTRLLRILLHLSADGFVEKKGYKDAKDVCKLRAHKLSLEGTVATLRYFSTAWHSQENRDFPEEISHSIAIVLRLYGTRMIISHKWKSHIIVWWIAIQNFTLNLIIWNNLFVHSVMATSRKHNKKLIVLWKYEFYKYEWTTCLPMLRSGW